MTFKTQQSAITAADQPNGSSNNSQTLPSLASSNISFTETRNENKGHQAESVSTSNSFTEIVTRLFIGKSFTKLADSNGTSDSTEKKPGKTTSENPITSLTNTPIQAPNVVKKACKPPLMRRFAHPCVCSQSVGYGKVNHNINLSNTNNSNASHLHLPPPAYTAPLHLYDPVSRKCLPTSRSRDMLLKDCHAHTASSFSIKPHHGLNCGYDDLICDARRFKCICKPPLHLYYDSTNGSYPSFGCVPLGLTSSPDGKLNCKSGQFYNVITKECQKVFDINDLPPNYASGVSATQFSFVTIVLIWILLLILIVTAKLRKLRTTNMYRNSPNPERRYQTGSHRHTGASAWMNPFIAAVNGHGSHLGQHRTTIDRLSQSVPGDGSGNYNDTDFFLGNGNRRGDGLFSDNNFSGSHQSLNNPPPKFEEIYPSRTEEQEVLKPSSNEDLPTYDEAMKLQSSTVPLEPIQKE